MTRMESDHIDIELCEVANELLLKDAVPVTGTVFSDTGETYSLTEFHDGIENGFKREWFSDGGIKWEGHYREGILHGECKEWYVGGGRKSSQCYEYGVAMWADEWDEEGNQTEQWKLDISDPQYEYVLKLRLLNNYEI